MNFAVGWALKANYLSILGIIRSERLYKADRESVRKTTSRGFLSPQLEGLWGVVKCQDLRLQQVGAQFSITGFNFVQKVWVQF